MFPWTKFSPSISTLPKWHIVLHNIYPWKYLEFVFIMTSSSLLVMAPNTSAPNLHKKIVDVISLNWKITVIISDKTNIFQKYLFNNEILIFYIFSWASFFFLHKMEQFYSTRNVAYKAKSTLTYLIMCLIRIIISVSAVHNSIWRI